MKEHRINLLYLLITLLTVTALFLSACGAKKERTTAAAYTSLSELEDKRIGVNTGSTQAQQVIKRFPDAELFYFSSGTDMLGALRAGRIDAFAEADALAQYMMAENPDLTIVPEKLSTGMKVCAIFPKTEEGRGLCDEYSEFIRKSREDGTYDELREIWHGNDESKRVAPEPVVMDFAAVLPAISTGKCDFACGGVVFTAERAESVLFSEPTYEGGSVIMVLKDPGDSEEGGLWSSIRSSFEKTFLLEGRWKLFIEGTRNTLVITILSALFGTILGFALYLFCRKEGRAAEKITGLFLWLIRGMPMVVLLMVLYYIIFSGIDVRGLTVAVIGFTLTFGAGMYGMLCTGVNAVVDGPDYDFLDAYGPIAEYCGRNRIPQRTALRIQLVFEELVQQILLPELADPKIRFTVKYSEENELPMTLLKSAVSSMEQMIDPDDELGNHICLEILS